MPGKQNYTNEMIVMAILCICQDRVSWTLLDCPGFQFSSTTGSQCPPFRLSFIRSSRLQNPEDISSLMVSLWKHSTLYTLYL